LEYALGARARPEYIVRPRPPNAVALARGAMQRTHTAAAHVPLIIVTRAVGHGGGREDVTQ
jgi:hypothetical protein